MNTCETNHLIGKTSRTRAPALWILATAVLVWVGACGDQTKGPSICDVYTTHLRTCGFLSEGEWQGCQAPETEEGKCELVCAAEAECADVLPLACEDTRSEGIAACTLECSTTTCKDGASVHKDKLCDMELDCNDGSDEGGCPDSFLCDDGSQVLPAYWQCDGASDCSDDSDEAGCAVELCGGATGSPGAVTTNGGTRCRQAVSRLKGCGLLSAGFWPCEEPDGAEACLFDCMVAQSCPVIESLVCEEGGEGGDTPPTAFINCFESCGGDTSDVPGGGFQCVESGEFVASTWVCDGDVDCEDGSDEEGCSEIEPVEQFQCDDGSQEYPPDYVCDGYGDCGDGSDEKGCDGFRTCADGTKTIAEYRFCNSATDCEDGSDEAGCAVLDCNPESLLQREDGP